VHGVNEMSGLIMKPLLTVVFATTADNMEDQSIVFS